MEVLIVRFLEQEHQWAGLEDLRVSKLPIIGGKCAQQPATRRDQG